MRDLARLAPLLLLCAMAAAAPSARLTITILDPDLRPVAGMRASVDVLFVPGSIVDDDFTRSDSSGRLVFDGLAPGTYRVWLGGGPYHDYDSGPVDLAPGENRLDAVVSPLDESLTAATVEVLVIGRDGRPAVNTEVEVDVDGHATPPRHLRLGGLEFGTSQDQTFWQRGVMATNAAGRIDFQSPPGPLSVCVTARHEEGHGHPVWAPPGRITWLRAYLAEARPKTDQPSTKPKPSEAPAKLRGRVLDADGRPMAGLRFVLRSAEDMDDNERQGHGYAADPAARPPRMNPGLTTDQRGRFELDGGDRWRAVRLKAAGWSSSEVEWIEEDGAAEIELRLTERARTARGRVVDAVGRPVPGAVAWAVPFGRYESDGPPLVCALDTTAPPAGGIRGLLPGGVFAAPCDADGRFVIDQLDAVSYRFLAWARGWGKPTVVTLQPSEAPGDDIMLHLTRLASLAGTVVRPDGSPWPGAPVRLRSAQPERSWEANADRDGRWRCLDLPPGRCTVVASLPGCLDQQLQLTLRGGETTEVALRPSAGHVLTGRVLASDGTPAADARVQCPMPDSEPRTAWTGEDGSFRLTGLRTGDRQLDLESAAGREAPIYVKVPRAEAFVIRLPQRCGLSGRVLGRGGQPLAGAECSLFGKDEANFEAKVVTGADGRFGFSQLRAGVWQFSADCRNYERQASELTLEPGEHRSGLTIQLREYLRASRLTGSLRGRVLQTDGTPAVGAEVGCDDTSYGGRKSVATDARGEFSIPKVAAGKVSVSVDADGCTGHDGRGVVEAGKETTLPDIQLLQRVVTGRLLNLPPGIRPQYCQIDGGVLALGADGRDLADRDAWLLPGGVEVPARGTGDDERAADEPPDTTVIGYWDFGLVAFPGARLVSACAPLFRQNYFPPPYAESDGTFHVPLTPGRQRLTVRTMHPRGPAGAWRTLSNVVLDVPKGGTARIDVPVSLGTAALAGRVRVPARRPDHEGEMSRMVVAAYPDSSWTPAAVTYAQPDGSWRLVGLAAGQYRVAYGPEFRGCRFTHVTALAGQTVTVACDDSGGETLRGRVGGKLPKRLMLTVESDAAAQSVYVAKDGRFAVPNLPTGSYHCTLWTGLAQKLVRPPGLHAVPGPEAVLDWP